MKSHHQACCQLADAKLLVLNNNLNPTEMNHALLGRSSLPTPTSIFSCLTGSKWYKNVLLAEGPFTNSGDCNVFGCNCDHCYGDSNCKGTDDAPSKPKSAERQKFQWSTRYEGNAYTDCPEAAPFLACPSSSGKRRLAGDATAASVDLEGVNCLDKNLVLAEPLNVTAARLTSVFCAPGGGEVGLSFAGQALDMLDADNSGSVDCEEWGIAKMRTSVKELVASGVPGYFGPAKLDPPDCKMSVAGEAKLAKYNAYLSRLTMETAAFHTTS